MNGEFEESDREVDSRWMDFMVPVKGSVRRILGRQERCRFTPRERHSERRNWERRRGSLARDVSACSIERKMNILFILGY